jgi:hypothetical protein
MGNDMPKLSKATLAARAHTKKSNELFISIGEMVVFWAVLEYDINSAIWALVANNDRDGACLTAQIPAIISRMRALIALVRENHGSDALVKKLNKFASEMDEIARSRNRIIHDRWLIHREDARVARLAVTADRRLVFEIEPHSTEAIADLTLEIVKASEDFAKLREEIGVDLSGHLKAQIGEEGGKAIQTVLDRLKKGNAPAKR